MTPEKRQQIMDDLKQTMFMNGGNVDEAKAYWASGYISGATAEADKAAALVEEKDREIERLKGIMMVQYKKNLSVMYKDEQTLERFWQHFKTENNL